MDGQMERMDRHTYKWKDTDRHRQTVRHIDRLTGRQTERQTYRQVDTKNRQTYTERHRQT